MFRCSRCGATKPRGAFTWSPTKGRDCYCRPCRSAYGREHYLRNKQRYIDRAKRYTDRELDRRIPLIVQYLEDHPCIDCGETDVVLLDFDHVEGKSFSIAAGIRYRNWDEVLQEIARCEVGCANCHRRRTAQAGRFRRYLLARSPRQRSLF